MCYTNSSVLIKLTFKIDSYSSVSTDHQATIRSSSEDSSSNHSEDAYHNDIGPKVTYLEWFDHALY